MNEIPAETANTEAAALAPEPKPNKKPGVGAHRPHVTTSKAKSRKQARRGKKAHKGGVLAKSAKTPKAKTAGVRGSSKTAQVLDLLRRSGGATLTELMQATGWQAHSVRGFLSGALRKKMGLALTSTKGVGEERRYAVRG